MRVLVCSFPEPSYLYPLVGLATALARRGHAVAFASGLPAAQPLAEVGFERIPRGPADGPSFHLSRWGAPLPTAIDVKHVEYATARHRPDVLVTHQLAQGPLIVRERLRVPTAVLGLFAYLWPVGRPAHPALYAANEARREWRFGDNLRCLNAARALFRLPALRCAPEESPMLGDLFLLRTAPRLEPELDALPARVHAVGACLWEPPRDGEAAWGALRSAMARPDAPLVYAQQGRTFGGPGFWGALVAAADALPLQFVALTGRMDQPAGALPPNVLAREFVPQSLVLPHARAVVSGGHTTAVLGALSHGTPQLVAPSGGETPDNATRVEAAGCGVCVPDVELTPERMRAVLAGLLDEGAARRAGMQARAALAPADDFSAAADLVEQLAAGRAPRRAAGPPSFLAAGPSAAGLAVGAPA